MEGLRAEGRCSSLGVCNFTPAALTALIAKCEAACGESGQFRVIWTSSKPSTRAPARA